VLVLQEHVPPYRVPIFSLLGERPEIELTVAVSVDRPATSQPAFRVRTYDVKRRRRFVRASIRELIKSAEYDVVVAMFNLRWIDFVALSFRRHRPFGLIYWGIGISSERGYRRRPIMDVVRRFVAGRADALILYSERAAGEYTRVARLSRQVFVAPNTVDVPGSRPLGADGSQSSFLFVGTMREDKGIDDFIDAYALARPHFTRRVTLTLIGDGPIYNRTCQRVLEMGLADDVSLVGAIHDIGDQERYFSEAIACISPRQAGLSVLSSMAYGVPFVTQVDSVTGGERFNIAPGENGVLYQGGPPQLAVEMVALVEDSERTRRMGRAAYDHYQHSATASHMIDGYVRAILFAASGSGRRHKR